MDNEFFINENMSDEMKLAFMQEMTVRESYENEKSKAFYEKFHNEIGEINSIGDIMENKELLGLKLHDGMGSVMILPMSTIGVLTLNDINIAHIGFFQDNGKFEYCKKYYCSSFHLTVEKDKFENGIIEDFLALPDILGVELIYRNHPNEFYLLPEEYEEGKGPLLLDARDRDDFKGIYNNNLCQKSGIAYWNENVLFLDIDKNRRY